MLTVGQGLIWYYGASNGPNGDEGRELLGHRGSDLGVCTEYYFDVKTDIGVVLLTNGDCDQVDGYEAAMDAITNKLFDTFESLLGLEGKNAKSTDDREEFINDTELHRGYRPGPGADLCDFQPSAKSDDISWRREAKADRR